MLSMYPAIFYREKDDSFSVVFPDLNHLATDGEDINEAMEMAVDCLAGYVFSAKQDGEELPLPTPIDKIDPHCEDDEDDDYESVFVSYVSVDVEEYASKHFEKAVKKTLNLPESLNKTAELLKVNFSALLKERLLKICGCKNFEVPNNSPALLCGVAAAAVTPFALAGVLSGVFTTQKNVKKTLTIPKWLNERAIAMNVNFSKELQVAVESAINSKNEKIPK